MKMPVALKVSGMNSKVMKKLFDLRPSYTVMKKQHSQTCPDMFKCHSDRRVDFSDKYKPLREEDYSRFISSRSLKREPALTRQITSLAYKVGEHMISLAEGMPNEEVFPFSKLRLELKNGRTLELEGQQLATSLQYVPSRGLPSLLTSLQQFQETLHRPPELPCTRELLVTNGAQHGIYQCMELLVEPGNPVLVSEFTYTGALIALKPYNPEILTIPEDADGMDPSALEAILATRLKAGLRMPKVMYLIPTGSNPTGAVISEDRRRRIYELACEYDFLILEDDPYMFLNYSETTVPSFLSLDACGRVVRLDSLSKVVSAGLRMGWLSAPAPLAARLELHAQAELLHPSTLSQAILLELLSDRESLASHLQSARELYRRRRDALHGALLAAQLGGLAEWTKPCAGLFLWLRVRGVDDVYNMVFQTAFKRGLMLIPGQAFLYDSSARSQHLRLTFSKVPIEKVDTAARHLADIIRDEQRRTAESRPQRLATER